MLADLRYVKLTDCLQSPCPLFLGTPFRQIVSLPDGNFLTTSQDRLLTYSPAMTLQSTQIPCGDVWGLARSPEGQVVIGDVKKKRVSLLTDSGKRLITSKVCKIKLTTGIF